MDNSGQNNDSNNNPKVVVQTSNQVTINTQNNRTNNMGQNTAMSAQKSLNDHLAENEKNNKPKVNVMNIFIYILMLLIIGVCVVLLLHFCDSSKLKEQKTTRKPTTTINFDEGRTTLVSQEPHYETTTTIPKRATHLALPNGNGANSYYSTTQVKITSTIRFTTRAPSSTPATKPTTTKKTSTTTTTTTSSSVTTTTTVSSNVNENQPNEQ